MRRIFFDLDGVLLNGWERSYQTYVRIMHECKATPLAQTKYKTLKRERIPVSLILKKSNAEAHLAYFQKRWMELIESPEMLLLNKLAAGTHAILEKLKKTHMLMLVTLRHHRKNLLDELNRHKLTPYFTDIISPTDGTRDKGMLLKKVAQAGDSIVGDTETEIRAAKELNLDSIAISTGFRSESLLKKERPNHIIRKLHRLHVLLARYEK